jgi:hypothetical protein
MNNKSRASTLKMGIADDAAEIWGKNDPKLKRYAAVNDPKHPLKNPKSSIAQDAEEVFGKGPVITKLEVDTLDVKENFMDEAKDQAKEKVLVTSGGGPPDPEDDDKNSNKNRSSDPKMVVTEEETKENENMKVDENAVNTISDSTRSQEKEFMNMYEEVRAKLEKDFGVGNGDYELKDKDDLYELVPERLPIDEDQAALVKKLVDYIVFLIDLLYEDKPYQRFYVLETIARVPYFSYISCLHYLETIGYNDNIGWLRVHWAEGWNELHHLLIMEELGGNKNWADRFLA